MAESISRRSIPRSGELLPVIGLGTWQTFDVGTSESERSPLKKVLNELVRLGGSVVDSSPMYGRSESVVGDLASDLGIHKRLFLATKVWTTGRDAGIRQMEESFRRLRTERIDLMQVHNLVDWRNHLVTLRRWKEEGRIRYIGVTHYTSSAYDDLALVLQKEELDFVQLNYSIAEREADRRVLPLAVERRLAVLVNRPFAQAGLFRKVRGKALPPWTSDIGCSTWAQFFLKFVVSHPAVTCTIPGTSKVEHLVDNLKGGIGALPDAAMRERMARVVADL
ncbi:MAG TPA: aldo/keto reductase [Candidatus Binatia bacterium]|nr:aldo/keto reductase [Candidatus Binatia bacterium]